MMIIQVGEFWVADIPFTRACFQSLRSPLTPLKKGGNTIKVPLFKGDLGGSERLRGYTNSLKTRPSGGGSKKRPILVLWLDGNDVVAAVVTSAKPRTRTDVELNDWFASGLRVPSTVRLSRLDCLEQPLLLAKIGQISEADGTLLKAI